MSTIAKNQKSFGNLKGSAVEPSVLSTVGGGSKHFALKIACRIRLVAHTPAARRGSSFEFVLSPGYRAFGCHCETLIDAIVQIDQCKREERVTKPQKMMHVCGIA